MDPSEMKPPAFKIVDPCAERSGLHTALLYLGRYLSQCIYLYASPHLHPSSASQMFQFECVDSNSPIVL